MATPTRINRLGRNSHKLDDRERVVVCMIHQLGYSQSQRCNFMQQDIANFIQYHGLSVTGMHDMHALHGLGVGVGVSTFYKGWHSTTQRHHAWINQVVREALEKKQLMEVIIDDYIRTFTLAGAVTLEKITIVTWQLFWCGFSTFPQSHSNHTIRMYLEE